MWPVSNNSAKVVSQKIIFLLVTLVLLQTACGEVLSDVKEFNPEVMLDSYNVVWDSPSENSKGSMPIGNGDIGLNVWVEKEGDIVFYISKTDAWSENYRLLKLGRVRIKLTPNPFSSDNFSQVLHLREGYISISSGSECNSVSANIWVDTGNPVVHLDIDSSREIDVQVKLEPWRTKRRKLEKNETFSACGWMMAPYDIYVEPDKIVDNNENNIIWYHRNERSIWADNLKLQSLDSMIDKLQDPLLNRTFGACIKGANLKSCDNKTLVSEKPSKSFQISIYPLTTQSPTAQTWLDKLSSQVNSLEKIDIQKARADHRKWWNDFWQRSWIFISGDKKAEAITRGYILQRYMNACSGRGSFPIKFNGSIFTFDDPKYKDVQYDADYRSWGGGYWWQNTRLIYWSMLMSGDYDLMKPLFRMYLSALPMAKERTKIYYGHDGALFPETMSFWGTYLNDNYGWDRKDMPVGLTENMYIRYYWQGNIELSAMMLDYYHATQDEAFLKDTALPLVNEIVKFYMNHYKRTEDGKIRFEPAQALETYWEVINPMPEIAGLNYLTEQLLSLPKELVSPQDWQRFQELRNALSPMPTSVVDGQKILAPAETVLNQKRHNMENIGMYAVFPYRRFGIGRENLDIALRTYESRTEKRTGGWFYASIMAAMIGKTDDAAKIVHTNFTVEHAIALPKNESPDDYRFEGFLGPNYDWVPDQDQPSVAMIALQRMLMQTVDKDIILFPSWPSSWNVDFKLLANFETTVKGSLRQGKVVGIEAEPTSRKGDIQISDKYK